MGFSSSDSLNAIYLVRKLKGKDKLRQIWVREVIVFVLDVSVKTREGMWVRGEPSEELSYGNPSRASVFM